MFKTSAGRTFCARPRSTTQTSPRRGIFLLVVQGKDAGGGGGQLVIRRRGVIKLGRAVKNDAAELPLLAGRKLLEFFGQMRGRCAHVEKIMRIFSRASWKMCVPVAMFDNGGRNKTRLGGCQCAATGLDFNHEQSGNYV